MTKSLLCWSCGAGLSELSLPLSRQDQCPACSNYLHVCRLCRHYDPLVAEACTEDDAEEVKEKERLNFCDYFSPDENAYDPAQGQVASQAQEDLAALFGDSVDGDDAIASGDTDDSQTAANKLFGDG